MTTTEIDECMVRLVHGATLFGLAAQMGTTHYKLRRELRRHHQEQYDAIMAERAHTVENREKRDAIACGWLNANKRLFMDAIWGHGGPRATIAYLVEQGYPSNATAMMRWWKRQPEHDDFVRKRQANTDKEKYHRNKALKMKGAGFTWERDAEIKPMDHPRLKPLRAYQDISEAEKTQIVARAKEILLQGLGRRVPEITEACKESRNPHCG